MKFRGGRIALDAVTTRRGDTGFADEIDSSGLLLLPGLINAHDHLEFALFPQLGTRVYSNASEWAHDVYRPDESPVKEHLSVPKHDRLMWGGIRNLLSGVTTVAHHNPYDDAIFNGTFPVRVLRNFGWAHSLAFAPNIAERFRSTPHSQAFIVHAAEGVDESASRELDTLDRQGLLTEQTVLVHALGLTDRQITLAKQRGASIIWCPGSNLASFGKTLGRETLDSGIPIALATDSSITAQGDLLDQIRIAHDAAGLDPERIYAMVTSDAARILRISHGQTPDIVAVKDEGQSPAEAIVDFRPEFVTIGDRLKLVSPAAASRFRHTQGLHPIHIEHRGEWLIDADVPELIRRTTEHLGDTFYLAGRKVLAGVFA